MYSEVKKQNQTKRGEFVKKMSVPLNISNILKTNEIKLRLFTKSNESPS